MADVVYLSSSVLQTICQGEWKGVGLKGFLIGDVSGSSPRSVTAVWQSNIIDVNELKEDVDQCLAHFPGGWQVVGVVIVPQNAKSIKSIQDKDQGGIDRELEEVLGAFDTWLDQLGLTRFLCLCIWQGSSTSSCDQHAMFAAGEDDVSNTKLSPDARLNSKIRMRLKADIPLLVSTESNKEEHFRMVLDRELVKLQNQCSSFVFGFFDNSVLLHQSGAIVGSAGEDWSSCEDVYKQLMEQEGQSGVGGSKKKGAAATFQVPVKVSMMRMVTAESSNSSQYAPIIRHQTGTCKTTSLSLPLDVLADVEKGTSLQDLAAILASAVYRQIGALFESLKVYTQKQELHTPEVFHFQLSHLDTPLTVIYPLGASEEELEPERQILHRHLCLPMSVPLLRRSCSGHFLQQTAPAGYLLNTHIGLPNPPSM
ncbi:ufm1-specific protease 2-like protein [Plakobranchus ocellatus]|uniref:Ufm1-specific protease 2-like protein n=1 Tax=Plakobranchus ocellatus TaxID=259542 RepID=A0AAV4BCJ6_9GAST|nr:ufm1-specific protease 2-like protein [Plakobranchus ocellatus]